jgi:hypothetical protein
MPQWILHLSATNAIVPLFFSFLSKKKKNGCRGKPQDNLPVDSFTFAARLSHSSSKAKLVWLSLKQQPYV